jgi:hypothetical protein
MVQKDDLHRGLKKIKIPLLGGSISENPIWR